jgi:hypothetical protein
MPSKKSAMSWANLSRMRKNFVKVVPSGVYSIGMENVNGIVIDRNGVMGVGKEGEVGLTNVLVMDTGRLECKSLGCISPFGVARSAQGHTFVSDSCDGVLQVFDENWTLTKEIREVRTV